MIINHNVSALNAYGFLSFNNSQVSKSLEKLSSGLRINRAADDAAGLVISEKMRAQIKGLDQARRNAQDGISMVQTAEGALSETHSILQRMRELAVQAANDTYTSNDRLAIQQEINQLKDEVNRIATSTEFNTKKLLDGSASALVSSDKLTTKIFMRDGLRVVDQFGQKIPGGGNYKLSITGETGTAQVQKTDLMRIKHAGENTVQDANVGYARFDGVIGTQIETAAKTTLTFTLDGQSYTVSAAGTNSNANALAIANAINANGDINTRLRATAQTATNTFRVERIDDPGKTFTVAWAVTGGAGQIKAFAEGTLTSASATAYVAAAATKNITKLTATAIGTLAGTFVVNTTASAAATADAAIINYNQYAQVAAAGVNLLTISAAGTAGTNVNQSVKLSVAVVNTSQGTITFNYDYFEMEAADGKTHSGSGTFTLAAGAATAAASLVIGNITYEASAIATAAIANYKVGDQVIFGQTATAALATYDKVSVTWTNPTDNTKSQTMDFLFTHDALQGKSDINFRFHQLDLATTSSTYGDTGLVQAKMSFEDKDMITTGTAFGLEPAASWTVAKGSTVGDLARTTSKLYDIEKFWDASGNFVLDTPKTITLIQGNGNQATIALLGSDTIQDVVNKLNEAIGIGLGQNNLDNIGADSDKYVSYVSTPTNGGLEAVAGTFVIRSAMAGRAGEINVIGDDTVLAALSLTSIQASSENKFSIDVTEAHKGTVIASDYKVEGNMLVGVIHQNVDVQFDGNTGIKTTWNETTKSFDFSSIKSGSTTFVHIADRSTVLQVGANPLQDLTASVGNMTAAAIGIDNLQVTSNTLANRAIATLDKAISYVSTERAKLGAVQNRLDHTINSLGATYENLVAAESRIRDVDMAKQMMEFTKYNILSQAATAMLAQANQLPQTVLQLLK